jgi:hypothetical protein
MASILLLGIQAGKASGKKGKRGRQKGTDLIYLAKRGRIYLSTCAPPASPTPVGVDK